MPRWSNTPAPLDLSPWVVRRITNGRYWLWEIEAPTEVAAAYERLWNNGRVTQHDGDLLIGWLVANTITKGDFELGLEVKAALEKLGWQPSDT